MFCLKICLGLTSCTSVVSRCELLQEKLLHTFPHLKKAKFVAFNRKGKKICLNANWLITQSNI